MKSSKHGKNISQVEVLAIHATGIWILVKGSEELFLAFEDFPWFRQASIDAIHNIKLLHNHHIYWPNLDIDLELDSIKNPEFYPLLSAK